jgi:hypothetical protein
MGAKSGHEFQHDFLMPVFAHPFPYGNNGDCLHRHGAFHEHRRRSILTADYTFSAGNAGTRYSASRLP